RSHRQDSLGAAPDFVCQQTRKAAENHQGRQQQNERQLPPKVRGVRQSIPFLRQRPVQHGPHRAQHINRSHNQRAPGGKNNEVRQDAPSAEKDGHFTRKVSKPGQTAACKGRHQQGRAEKRQPPQQSSQLRHFQSAGLLVNVAAQTKRQRRQKTMSNHHHHRPRDANQTQTRDPQKHKSHVRHARVPEHPVEILLLHRDQSAINDVAQAKPAYHRRPVPGRIRQQRQRNPDQPVQAELLQYPSMEHGGRAGRRGVAQRRPGMEWPERNQNAEPEQKQRKDKMLRSGRKPDPILPYLLKERRNVKRMRAGLNIDFDESKQRQQRPQAEINCDLKGGILLLGSTAPDANHDERGYQSKLMEKVKEEKIQGRKRAQDAPRHDQQQNIELFLPCFDFPGRAGGGK